MDPDSGQNVSIKEYIDTQIESVRFLIKTRFKANDKATKLALKNAKFSAHRNETRFSFFLSILAIAISVMTAVIMIKWSK